MTASVSNQVAMEQIVITGPVYVSASLDLLESDAICAWLDILVTIVSNYVDIVKMASVIRIQALVMVGCIVYLDIMVQHVTIPAHLIARCVDRTWMRMETFVNKVM